MYRRLFCFALASLAAFHLSFAVTAQEVQVNGKVTHVTLYRSQALVTRTLAIAGAEGSLEIVVGDLPENVITDSLFAELRRHFSDAELADLTAMIGMINAWNRIAIALRYRHPEQPETLET